MFKILRKIAFNFLLDIPSHMKLYKKNPTANTGDLRDVGQSLNWEDPLEKDMATHITVLA